MYQNKVQKKLDIHSAKIKAEAYCAYQERSQQEVRSKLLEWEIYGNDLENILSQLIADNFLNEARFSQIYANGKLRIKHWGKIKIKQGLKLKGISEAMIKKTLNALDEEEYLEKLKMVLQKKSRELGNKEDYATKNKLIKYALSRGF